MTYLPPSSYSNLAQRLGNGEDWTHDVKAATGITVKPRPGGNLFVDYEMEQDGMPYPVATTWRVEQFLGDDPAFVLIEWNPTWEVLQDDQPPRTNPTTEEVYEAVLEAAQDQWKEKSG